MSALLSLPSVVNTNLQLKHTVKECKHIEVNVLDEILSSGTTKLPFQCHFYLVNQIGHRANTQGSMWRISIVPLLQRAVILVALWTF